MPASGSIFHGDEEVIHVDLWDSRERRSVLLPPHSSNPIMRRIIGIECIPSGQCTNIYSLDVSTADTQASSPTPEQTGSLYDEANLVVQVDTEGIDLTLNHYGIKTRIFLSHIPDQYSNSLS